MSIHQNEKTKLPYETLEELIGILAGFEDKGLAPEDEYFAYLEELKKVYIPCDKCGRMIAPDETFEIVNEETVCEDCVET